MSELQKKLPTKTICKVILALLLLTQASLLAYLSWSTSPNRTETGHIGATVYLWQKWKLDVFHVNPPLVRFVAGAPVALFCNPSYDWVPYYSRPQDRSEWRLGSAFIIANDLDDLRLYVFLMRLACISLILLGGYFGYRFASELYGRWSGVTFLVLWTFSPLILGWGATICPDVHAASLGIIGLYTFWRWLKSPTLGKAFIAGVCLGLLPLTKMTWIIAFPIWLLLWGIWRFCNIRQFAVIMLLGVFTINAGYLYDGSFHQLKDYQFISSTLTGHEVTKGRTIVGNRFTDTWIGLVPVPLPAEFVQGIDTQKIDFERGIESYARGEWSDRGWWWYYGYVLLLKEPLGVWGLLLLVLLVSCVFRNANATWRDELTILMPLLTIFVFISSQDGFSIHPRYVVFVLPLLYIFVSKVASHSAVVCRLLSAVLLIWVVGSSMSFYPFSMSYFNELAESPKNYPQYLLGSNIDWGQDAYALKAWVERNPESRPLYISYTAPIPLTKLGIESNGAVPTEPLAGWMIVGVNNLFMKDGKRDWLKSHEPVGMVGYSIWIFEIEEHAVLP